MNGKKEVIEIPLIDKEDIKLAILGMVDGNGHPYSWSAMFNGYNIEELRKSPYPGIADYLEKQPDETLGIKGAKVTHIWTDDPEATNHVARASLIPNIVKKPEEVIGEVDAVIIATDKGWEHVERCRPFVEAGIPVFVDKPLADNEKDLKIFSKWIKEGKIILSSSCMRYCKEFLPFRCSTHNLGKIRFASITTDKSWERYGIHALEGIYPILGPGFISVRNIGTIDRNIVHLKHSCSADVIIAAIDDMDASFGVLKLCGTKGYAQTAMVDDFYAFKTQLESFIIYLRTGSLPFPFSETEELMKIIIAGIQSRNENGKEIMLESIVI
jgi:hypothetical protein